MPANEIHVDDLGTKFIVTVKDGDSVINVSGATTKNIIFKKPSGTKVTAAASFETDGSDGVISYIVTGTEDDDLGVLDVRDMPHFDGVIRMPISVPLTLPTLDADNIEVSRMDSLLIAKLAAAKLLIKDMMNSPATHRQRAQERAGILMQEVRQLSEGRGATTETAVTISPVW